MRAWQLEQSHTSLTDAAESAEESQGEGQAGQAMLPGKDGWKRIVLSRKGCCSASLLPNQIPPALRARSAAAPVPWLAALKRLDTTHPAFDPSCASNTCYNLYCTVT